jgi:TonB family protein
MMLRTTAVVVSVAITLSAVPLSAQAPPPQRPSTDPLPIGQRMTARDGDVVVVEDDARVRIVRRREANVRVIYNAAQRWVVILVDYLLPDGGDGRVDTSYTFSNLTGDWPLEPRWEGTATLEDYLAPGEFGPQSFGLVTPRGLVQILTQPAWLKDPAAVAVLTSRGSGRSSGPKTSFDEAERRNVEAATRGAERNQAPAPNYSSSIGMTMTGVAGGIVTSSPGELAPVRVGGSIRQPMKIVDAKPVYPETARQAGISGVVILEIVIDTDGSVKQARVLRSIPLLDTAAVDTVKQWRYEPTQLNGNPVPVIMTVTVNFTAG